MAAKSFSMRGVKTLGCVIILATLVGCDEPGMGRDNAADVAAINAIGEEWMDAYEAGDYDRILDLYTEDAWIMARGRPKLEGREAIRRSFGGLAAGRGVDIDIVVEEVEVRGDWAWLVSDFTVKYREKGEAAPTEQQRARSLLIYKKGGDGKWRIHRDMDSPAPEQDTQPLGGA